VTGYAGTVHLTSSDGAAALPADYTFVPGTDMGKHTFTVTFNTTGAQTITATDTKTASITGSESTTVRAAATATSFLVEAPHYAVAGGPITVTVLVLDQYHHVMPGYAGTVHLTSNDSSAVLPADYTFVPGTDMGKHTFTVTFKTVGAETITATDTKTASITGQATVNVEAAGAVTHFGIYDAESAPLGIATPVEVVALDANNHVVAGYTGTVHFTSTDTTATLPADYTFQSTDNGAHVFSVTFDVAGSQTLTVTDTSASTITASRTVNVRSKSSPFGIGLFGNGGYFFGIKF
jgi:hypothetical protein